MVNAQLKARPLDAPPLDLSGLQCGTSLLRHHDGREGTFVEIEPDGRIRVQSLKGRGFWTFHPDDCAHVGSREPVQARPLNRRQTAKAATRARILAAARDLFEAGTYADATIRGIAAAAGVSTGAVFATVPDKATLWRLTYGGPAPSDQTADEIARALGQMPHCRWTLTFNNPGFAASIHSRDFNPVTRQGLCWTAHGDSPAAALRKAREAATHAVRQTIPCGTA